MALRKRVSLRFRYAICGGMMRGVCVRVLGGWLAWAPAGRQAGCKDRSIHPPTNRGNMHTHV